jgi:hypothetical protein
LTSTSPARMCGWQSHQSNLLENPQKKHHTQPEQIRENTKTKNNRVNLTSTSPARMCGWQSNQSNLSEKPPKTKENPQNTKNNTRENHKN